ncbi:ABC transporter substrate-binding protein [Rhodoferax sp.]|uniref:ABC transporter substrate-binding protein n=1 Tax=Rhodoferax sp. TaxID=50421 RepID=UPI002611A437|nr:ABC transporter substrate-binding protein [Rhodoferax sp.]MDD3937592.1 ABC transporter substrate-binding protein [Rhodoferax sp.]
MLAKDFRVSVTTILGLVLAASSVMAQKKYDVGASDTEIKIGNLAPYSGPASAYAVVGKTAAAYYKKINDEGGINGRKINFISLDDGYSPPKSVEMTRRLIEQDQVLFIAGSVGTAPISATYKYAAGKGVPHLFAASAATKFQDPKNPLIIGWAPSYYTEGSIYAKHILQNTPDAKVAVLYQNDDYGKEFLQGFENVLGAKAKTMIVAKSSYEVTDTTLDSQIVQLQGSGANVFVNIATPKFAAMAIRKVYDIGWKPLHYMSSPATSIPGVLIPAGLEKATGIISTQFFKDPMDSKWKDDKAMKEWRAFMAKYYPDGDVKDDRIIYGYGLAKTVVEALKQCGDNLTRENLMKQATNLRDFQLDVLIPGIKINTSPTDYAPIKQMQMMRFDGKEWVLFGGLVTK